MPGKGKRKDNPGKMDRVNPPLKTRIPVTDHPKPQQCTTPPPSAKRAIWCLRELLTYIKGDVERIFDDKVFVGAPHGSIAPPTTTESSTQTTPPPQSPPPTPKPKPLTNSVSTNTDLPPTRTYAEAATTTTSPKKTTPSRAPQPKGKGKAITTPTRATPPPRNSPLNQARAIVLHAAPMKYKPGLMRRWIEEDNEGARILGIRWLLQEGRRVGKLASSLVIYLAEGIDTTRGLHMGRRVFRTSEYEWNR
ncbi:hypothetical protein L211DRAFT_840851 [Terfezia boudieri ATCC MYA-4762]|uniref:Uncharacterized protein n=1 Tax=Terfezia boudieri ATCC MYA-4762 TaxID=1051890 RepID=A0A3N4LEC5_9PEZI|nr:hypothetical protein L211DRAFT_840851 [Terfezia boudieri ATCC MYA-4762]